MNPDPLPGQQGIDFNPPVRVVDPHAAIEAHPRLNKQSRAILAAFLAAPEHKLDGEQLTIIARRFGARIHDIRKAQYHIDLVEHVKKTGHTVYQLRITQ